MNVEDGKYQHFLNVLPGYSAGGESRNPLAGLRLFFRREQKNAQRAKTMFA